MQIWCFVAVHWPRTKHWFFSIMISNVWIVNKWLQVLSWCFYNIIEAFLTFNVEDRRRPLACQGNPFSASEEAWKGIAVFWTDKSRKKFNFATSKIKKNNNSTIDLLSLCIYAPGPQVLTFRPRVLRGVRIWTPFRVPGPERRVIPFRS